MKVFTKARCSNGIARARGPEMSGKGRGETCVAPATKHSRHRTPLEPAGVDAVAGALGDEPALEVGDGPDDVEDQLAGGLGGVDVFFEADQVDVVRLEVFDRFEEFLEGAPEAVEARDAEVVAGAVDQLRQPRTLEVLSGDHVDENANGAGLAQAVFLAGDVLVRGGHTGIAEQVATAGFPGRLSNARPQPYRWRESSLRYAASRSPRTMR